MEVLALFEIPGCISQNTVKILRMLLWPAASENVGATHIWGLRAVGGVGTFGSSKTFLDVQEPTLIEINSKANV